MKCDNYRGFFEAKYLMGPNSMRLLEELTTQLGDFFKGARVMDMGCGQGLSSLYVAKELGVKQLFCVDLWVSANDMQANFEKWGTDDICVPIHADAREMPFPDGFFDVITTVDSYHYFGGEMGFFAEKIWPYVKKGGYFMMCVPGLKKEFEDGVPAVMSEWAGDEVSMFHSCDWWERVLTCGAEDVEWIRSFESSVEKEAWEEWFASGHEYAVRDKEFFDKGIGEYLNFAAVVIKKK